MKVPMLLKKSFIQLLEQAIDDFPNSAPRPDLEKQITAGPFLVMFRERFTDWVIANNVDSDLAIALWNTTKQQVMDTCNGHMAALQ
jgi:hypothetical protein